MQFFVGTVHLIENILLLLVTEVSRVVFVYVTNNRANLYWIVEDRWVTDTIIF